MGRAWLLPGPGPLDSQRYSLLSHFYECIHSHGRTPRHPAAGRRKQVSRYNKKKASTKVEKHKELCRAVTSESKMVLPEVHREQL